VELEELDFLLKHLFVIAAGVKVGELIRGQLNPAHSMIAIPNVRSVYPMIELELESALLFLNRGDLKIATPTQGWALVSYQGRLLGFVKVLPNRVNNYYPKEWRIRFLES
jgi:NOL1/NOP2/fmu family ribosome biogenesis protein